MTNSVRSNHSSMVPSSETINTPTTQESTPNIPETKANLSPRPQETSTTSPLDTSTGRPLKISYRTPRTAADPPEIRVASDFSDKPGQVLSNGWVLGRKFGQGVQGQLYLVVDKDEKDASRVFKHVNVRAIARVSGALVGLEREWAIGRELNLLNEEDGFLEGFMQTGSKVLNADGSFLGVILERMNGKDVRERLEDTCFNDTDYVTAMVMQVLRALDRARLAIGFQHRDTNAHNVMEHWLDEERRSGGAETEQTPPETEQAELGRKLNLHGLHFKIIDYGHSFTNKNDAVDANLRRKASRVREPKIPVYSAEHLYRYVFRGRSDTWRFMLSLGRALEGRVKEQADEKKVRLLMETIRYTTGYSHNLYFATSPGQHKQSLFRRPMSVGGPLYGLKWIGIMSRAFICPSHPGTTPREALDFTEEQRIRMGLSKEDVP